MLTRFSSSVSMRAWPRVGEARLAAVLSFVLWLAVAFSALTWVLRGADGLPAAVEVAPVALPQVSSDAVAQALGAPAGPAQAPSSRLQLLGVWAEADGRGVALIAREGQATKAYRVGKPVGDGLVLQSVQARQVTLGTRTDGPATLTLTLPARP